MAKGYAGTVDIKYHIFRYQHNLTKDILLSDQVPIGQEEYYEELSINLEVTGLSYYLPGKPEDCHSEIRDVEAERVIGPDGKDWLNKLSKQEKDSLFDIIDQTVRDRVFE